MVVWESELDEIAPAYAGKNVQYATTGEDIASIIDTSGSTGLPKGIVISLRNLKSFSNSNGWRIQTGDEKTKKDRIHCCNPHELYHVQADIRPIDGR